MSALATRIEREARRSLTPIEIFNISASRETTLSRLLTLYICTGLAFMLLPGTFLGLWNLIAISSRQSTQTVSSAWIQAHGHAQIFGWIGTFILVIGFYSIPKLRRLKSFALSAVYTAWGLWTTGVTTRWICTVYNWHWRTLLPLSAALELAAFLIFFSYCFGTPTRGLWETLKEAKKIDALLRQSEVLMKLQEMDKEEANQTLQDEHAALSAQHAADSQRIQELEAQITALRTHRCEIKTIPDPEHTKTLQQCEILSAALKFLAGVSSHKEHTAIRAIQELPVDAASLVCEAVGINDLEYRQYLHTYKTERDLLNVVERADPDTDTSFLLFCRAALAVNHSLNVVSKPTRVDWHSVQEEQIKRERQENAERQARMEFAWRRQMGL